MANREQSEVTLNLRPLLETALDAVVAMTSDGIVAEWNPVAERTFGWKREEAIGRLMADLIVPPVHREAHIKGIERYNRTGEARVLDQRLEISAIDRDGREFPVELSITATKIAGQKLFVGFLRDIGDRKRAEQILVRQAHEAELLFEVTRFAAESESVEPVIAETLKAICQLTGWPVGHAFAISAADPDLLVSTDIWHGSDHPNFDRLRKVTRSTEFKKGVGLPGLILESGEPAWFSDTENEAAFVRKGLGFGAAFGFPLKSSGEIVAVLEFFTTGETAPDAELLLTVRTLGEQVGRVFERSRSLAELRRLNETLELRVAERSRQLETANEALRQSQKMEAIGQLTGGIAHDFNKLLTVIRGSADLLRRPNLAKEKRKRYLDAISDTADRASKLTSQLLAFARRQALKPQRFDIAVRIRGIADMLRTILGSRVELVIEIDCVDCYVEADIGQFETALVNLIVNARDAMNGEGKLRILVANATGEEGVALASVAISDTGLGIAEDHLPHIFEPFFTTKDVGKGTGLGLSQVYGFIKQSDGDIRVASEVGVGTTITLTLPRVDGAPDPESPAPSASGAVPEGGRILIVEDNAEVGEFAASLLSELGFETCLASNGHEALEKLDQTPKGFDIVFSDVVMPGMNGLDLGEKVRERWPNIPVVLTSGYSEVLAAESSKGFPLLQKPYSADSLARILAEARRGRPVSPG